MSDMLSNTLSGVVRSDLTNKIRLVFEAYETSFSKLKKAGGYFSLVLGVLSLCTGRRNRGLADYIDRANMRKGGFAVVGCFKVVLIVGDAVW